MFAPPLAGRPETTDGTGAFASFAAFDVDPSLRPTLS